jgi:inorganic triphosphatase YgiF
MQEIELKFQVPASRRAAVQARLNTLRAEPVRLAARYFDTPGRHLAQAGFALRLRLEGSVWVQTLKGRVAGAAGLIERLEHNAPLPDPAEALPALDLQRHQGTPAGQALLGLLASAGVGPDDLQLQYDTDITRLQKRVRHGAAEIELAFDLGAIRCGARTLPVCELELELLDGPRADLIDAARAWVREHALWLDVRSKAERGDRLARGLDTGRAVPAHVLPARVPLAELLGAALAQILPNLADVAGETAAPEQLPALRQGLAGLHGALADRADVPPDVWQAVAALLITVRTAQALRDPPAQAAVLTLLGASLG